MSALYLLGLGGALVYHNMKSNKIMQSVTEHTEQEAPDNPNVVTMDHVRTAHKAKGTYEAPVNETKMAPPVQAAQARQEHRVEEYDRTQGHSAGASFRHVPIVFPS